MRAKPPYLPVTVVALFATIVFGCQDKIPTWPQKIISNLYVPKDATRIKYSTLQGSYQVSYINIEPFPGGDHISAIVQHMQSHGWRRLEEDFLNPGLKPALTRTGNIAIKWESYLDGDQDVAQWIEDWEDSENNIVRYGLKYVHPTNRKFGFSEKDKDMKVVVIYVPNGLRPDPEEFAKQGKEFKQRMDEKSTMERRRWMRQTGP